MTPEEYDRIKFRPREFIETPEKEIIWFHENAEKYLSAGTIYELWWELKGDPYRKTCFLMTLDDILNLPIECVDKNKYIPEKGAWFLGRFETPTEIFKMEHIND